MGALRGNLWPNRAPQAHLLVDAMRATRWQAHSVRGFLSGQVGKKMACKVKSFQRDGQRVYVIQN